MNKSRIGQIFLVIATMLWGTSYVVMNNALNANVDHYLILAGRFLLASLLMFLLFHKQIIKNLNWESIKQGLILSVTLYAGFYFQLVGLKHSTPAMNAMITSGYVVLVPFVVWIITKNRPRKINFIAAIISFIGIAIISLDFDEGLSVRYGDMLALLSAVSFAIHLVLQTIMVRISDYKTLVFIQFLITGVVSAILFFMSGGDIGTIKIHDGQFAILYLGILCTFACYLLEGWSLRYVDATLGSLIMATECIFAAVFSLILGMDHITWQLIVGGILLFGAVILQTVYKKKPMTQVTESKTN